MTDNNKADAGGLKAFPASRNLPSAILFLTAAAAAVAASVLVMNGSHGAPWVTFAGAVSLLALGLGVRCKAILSGAYAALVIAGWAAQLALTQPRWFGLVERPHSLNEYAAAAMLVVEAMAAAIMLIVRRRAVWNGLRTLDRGVWIGLFALAALSCVTFSSHIGAGDYRGLLGQWIARMGLLALHAAALTAFVVSLPREALATASRSLTSRVTLPGAPTSELRSWDKLVAPAAAAFVLAVCIAYALLSFGAIAHLEDEAAYLFQARTIAGGSLWAAPPPAEAREAFHFYLLTVEGDRWFSVTVPGWPAVLSLGVLIGAPWLVNPLLAAASVLLAHALVRRLADRGIANITAVLMVSSPWLHGIGGSMMPHAVTLAATLGAVLTIAKARDMRLPGALVLALAAGCLMGLVFLARPQEGLVVGIVAGLWILFQRPLSTAFPSAFAYAVGCLLIGGLLLLWNLVMTGDPAHLVQSEYLDRLWVGGSNRFGFGPDIGPPERWGALDVFWPGHTPLEALVNAQHSLSELSLEMYGWSIGSLGLTLLALTWTPWRGFAGMMILVSAMTVVGYLFYWHTGGYYVGPRYWFMLFAPVAVLSAMGVSSLAQRLSKNGDGARRLGAMMIVLMLQGMVMSGWRLTEHFPNYNGYNAYYRTLAENSELKNGLIFVHDGSDSAYGPAIGLTDPGLREGKPIFLRPGSREANERAAAAFAGREPMHVSRDKDGALRLHPGLPPPQ